MPQCLCSCSCCCRHKERHASAKTCNLAAFMPLGTFRRGQPNLACHSPLHSHRQHVEREPVERHTLITDDARSVFSQASSQAGLTKAPSRIERFAAFSSRKVRSKAKSTSPACRPTQHVFSFVSTGPKEAGELPEPPTLSRGMVSVARLLHISRKDVNNTSLAKL